MEACIFADMREKDGIEIAASSPVSGGWLNRKWKVETSAGTLVIKQFSFERYTAEKLERIEAALGRQMAVYERGVLCPRICPFAGRAIRFAKSDIAYMVMAFRDGHMESPATVTNAQMSSLGSALGFLHKAFQTLSPAGVCGYPARGEGVMNSLWENFRARRAECGRAPAAYGDAVSRMEPLLRKLTPDFFKRLPAGIAHEDFSPDNILFRADGVSAILDFDRNQYGYVWHDVGRALLSLACKDGRLSMDAVRAFSEGYSVHRAFSVRDVADALRLTWCIETPWWIRPEFFTGGHAKVLRFRDEMIWLTTHFDDLDDMMR